MPNDVKHNFLAEIAQRYGSLRKLDRSLSLYELGKGEVRIYIRYSKVHRGNRAWYGLRNEDLKNLEGHQSLICFLWEGQSEPLFVPYSQYEEVFHSISPSGDGQYKSLIYLGDKGVELYINNAGRFKVESNLGWHNLDTFLDAAKYINIPTLSHSQVQ